ncbi:AsmA family protein [Puniceicoccaceae bacterium K14]|nr:AsmA family protein [Puniceicoccaceae bacterium K14]
MKKLITVFLVFAVIAVAIFLSFSKVLSKGIVAGVETYGPDVTQTEVTLESVNLSAFSGKGAITGFVVGNPEGFSTEHAIKLDDFQIDLKPASVISDKIVINEIIIDGPQIIYETNSEFKTNIGTILKNVESFAGSSDASEEAEEQDSEGSEKKLEIGLFRLSNAKVQVVNPLLGGDGLSLELPVIELEDLGKGEEGMTIADVMKKVLASVNQETITAMSKNGGDLGNQVEEVGKKAKESVGNLLKGFKKSVESE